MDDFERELQQTFLAEATENLVAAEDAFMALDDGDRSPDLINRIFRLAHNFKGSAKSVGFDQLSQFAHAIEDVLTAIKKGSLEPDQDVCTVLLESLDILKAFIVGLKADLSFKLDTSRAATKINALLTRAISVDQELTTDQNAQFGFFDDAPSVGASKPINEPTSVAANKAIVKSPAADDVLRVSTNRIDQLLNLVGELVVNQSIMKQHRLDGTTSQQHAIDTMAYTEKLALEIQDLAMSLRMVPIKPLMQKLKRTARDIAIELGKEVEIEVQGEHVELDKTILDKMADPMNHIVRNAVDHGIENREERDSASKQSSATLRIVALQQDDRLQLRVADDGRGLNKEKILNKALEKGLIRSHEGLSDSEIHALIFRPGFSTKDIVSDISGRGVGMEVVQVAIDELKGSITIESTAGKGTEFIISLPLSLSIVGGLVVTVDSQKYVIPISQLVETLEYSKLRVETSTDKGRMVCLRNEVIPIYSLKNLLHGVKDRQPRDKQYGAKRPGLVAVHRGHKVSFEVDEILGQQQVVLKKLGRELKGLPGILAGAILSSGEPGLVLNLPELIANRIAKGGQHAA